MKWSYIFIFGLLALLACIAGAAADNGHTTPHHYQYSWQDPTPVWQYPEPVWQYTGPVWHYTPPVWQYTAPILQPVVQIGSKIYYSLNMGKYYSFATNSLRFPVGVWWV